MYVNDTGNIEEKKIENTTSSESTSTSTCTAWTYSDWGDCQSDSTQTRTILTSSPEGCIGGSPVTSQSCAYVASESSSSNDSPF